VFFFFFLGMEVVWKHSKQTTPEYGGEM